MPVVISLANMKGGVGKTTLCVNLAFALFRLKKKVLVIDNDPQFNATIALLKPDDYIKKVLKSNDRLTIYDIYEKPPRIEGRKRPKSDHSKFFLTTYHLTSDNSIVMDLIPSRIELYATLRAPSQKEYLLDKFLKQHAQKYDFILIDCPPTPSVLTVSAFAASQFVIIPVKPDFFSTLGLPQFIGTLEDFKENLVDQNNVQPLCVVFTDVPRNQSVETTKSIKSVRESLESISQSIPILEAQLSHWEVLRKTLRQAEPVQRITGVGVRGRAMATQELNAIALELMQMIVTNTQKVSHEK